MASPVPQKLCVYVSKAFVSHVIFVSILGTTPGKHTNYAMYISVWNFTSKAGRINNHSISQPTP